MARRDDAFGNRGDLLRSLSGPEDDFGKALPDAAMVIDPGEAKVLEGGLAQILKEAVLRRLRCKGAAATCSRRVLSSWRVIREGTLARLQVLDAR